MSKIKGIVYDADGTLLDTREWILSAFENSIKVFGFPKKTRAEISRLIGQSLKSCYEELIPGGDTDLLIKTHKDFQHQRMELIKPFPNLIQLLEDQSGLKQGIVSSRVGDLEESLEMVGVSKYFEFVISANDVEHEKPHPEPMLMALDKFGLDPDTVTTVGDGKADILSSKAAKIPVSIGITHGFGSEEDLRRAGADHIVHDFAELSKLLYDLS